MEGVIEIIKYGWIPLIGLIWRDNEKKIESVKVSIEKSSTEIDNIKNKVAHQMTKDDVHEVVNTSTKLLTAEIKLELQKIESGVHYIKNQKSGEEGTLHEVLDQLKILNEKNNDRKR